MKATQTALKTSEYAGETAEALAAGARPSTWDLPETPLVTIKGGRRWASLDLLELWHYRDLFYFLIWRDVKVRYKQTLLGVAWAVLQPLLTMVIFTVLFGRLARVPSDGQPYPIFVYAGLLPWNFFATAVTASSNSLVGNAALITKVYFPRLVIPGSAVCAGLVDFAIAAAILFAMCLYYHVGAGLGLLMLVPLTLLATMFAAASGLWLSAMNVKYRDVRYALPFMIQIWMYLTPVIYPISFIPRRWRWAAMLNPMGGIIEGFRAAIFNRPFNWTGLAVAAAITAAVFLYAAYDFRRMERAFADVI
ncbi:MAG: ABC transporter permease [Candidatus Binataceae bacterium]